MVLRFRKSIRIAKGVRLNVGKRGMSLSFAGVNISSRGVTAGLSIPGTGISYRAPIFARPRIQQNKLVGHKSAPILEQDKKDNQELKLLQQRAAALSKITASLNEDGSVILTDANGIELNSAEINMAWEQKEEVLREWLLSEVKRIEDIKFISDVHLDTPNPSNISLYEPAPFLESAPSAPLRTDFREIKPELALPMPLGFFSRFSRSRRDAYAKALIMQEEQHRHAMKAWHMARREYDRNQDEAFATYRTAYRSWEQRKQEHEEKERQISGDYQTSIGINVSFMAQRLEQELERLSWPRETAFRIAFMDEGQSAALDVDLPEIDDIPRIRASIAPNGRRLTIKEKSEKALRQDYARHIHGIALRLMGVVFSTLPACQQVMISGYSQRLDKSTGNVRDEYLYSVIIDRNTFSNTNFDALELIDPVSFLERGKLRRNMTATGIFRSITPFDAEELSL